MLKRTFDILISLLGTIVSLPLGVLISLFIIFEDGFPILYSQSRVGKDGKVFQIIKFRSMVKDAEKDTGVVFADKNDPRITNVGKIIRITAMDELPQLLSIFKGDMSFVGPRPERPELTKQFAIQVLNYDLRHKVKPGLTGIAQIRGQYDTPARNKLRYDLFYISKQNFFLDLKIIIISFLITFQGGWESKGKKLKNLSLFNKIKR